MMNFWRILRDHVLYQVIKRRHRAGPNRHQYIRHQDEPQIGWIVHQLIERGRDFHENLAFIGNHTRRVLLAHTMIKNERMKTKRHQKAAEFNSLRFRLVDVKPGITMFAQVLSCPYRRNRLLPKPSRIEHIQFDLEHIPKHHSSMSSQHLIVGITELKIF